jgi:type IV pilus assembly PilN-like protein
MQVKLNLAIRPSLRERYSVYWTVPLMIVSLGGFFWMISHGISGFERYRRSQVQVSEEQAELTRLENRERDLRKQFDQPGFRETALKAQMVNMLIERKVVSFPVVTDQVARLLPAEVRLTGLALSLGETGPAVRITVVGKSESAVEGVLKALQDSAEFADAEIRSEDTGMKENGGAGVGMVLSARYVGKMGRT